MKLIFGLDLGTTSVGWAVVNESENSQEESKILDLGVRSIPLSVDEQTNFGKGKPITTNADRRLKHSMRLSNHRFKLRRENLKEILLRNGFINEDSVLNEDGPGSTHQTINLRAKAASEKVSLEELARVLLHINKKRGYKSSRKTTLGDVGRSIDGLDVALELHSRKITPGKYGAELLAKGAKRLPDFYPSDLQNEIKTIFALQSNHYKELSDTHLESIANKNESQTWAIIAKVFNLQGVKRPATRGIAAKRDEYNLRAKAVTEKISTEEIAFVISKINGQIAGSSGYLGAISDRSKTLAIEGLTVGQHIARTLQVNPHYSFKNQAFYRKDYIDEFDQIWYTQSKFHPELTEELKQTVKDTIIFYQRPLKSQKSKIAYCTFESRQETKEVKGKLKTVTIGRRVSPKSSPVFCEFAVWQSINNLCFINSEIPELSLDEKRLLFSELNYKERMTDKELIKMLRPHEKGISLNFKTVTGNSTNAAILKAMFSALEVYGYDIDVLQKLSSREQVDVARRLLADQDICPDILSLDTSLTGKDLENQAAYKLWHLLYSYDGDDSASGNETLINNLIDTFGFNREAASIIASISFPSDYGSLSVKAMQKILVYLKEGEKYDKACALAGYRHSESSRTKEEIETAEYADFLEILPKNFLRNPVVEKILNQMINVVNSLMELYGRPDEIRVELAREMKKNAKERKEASDSIAANTKENERIAALLKAAPFNISNPSRNDIVRYKLYEELAPTGYKTLYTDTYIPKEELFSKNFDIEHIIPQSKLFDDSFANKTLETRAANIEKSNMTAIEYILLKYGEDGVGSYSERIKSLLKDGEIGKRKAENLLRYSKDIPDNFIERDLRDTQYISKKARQILETVAPYVIATTGAITDRLRQDWGLVDIMKELNWDKYNRQGLTEIFTNRDQKTVRRIVDWSKRNDNRHHAMDALTIAFTRRQFIQYLNNLNAQSVEGSDIKGIKEKFLYRDKNGKLLFKAPMDLAQFRREARKHLENILVSFKAKTKVVSKNVNITKGKKATSRKVQLTPRGQLHNETVYGAIKQYVTEERKINADFDYDMIARVASKEYREALSQRLNEYGGDSKKAFTGKNAPDKNPIKTISGKTLPPKVKIVGTTTVYTIRKLIDDKLKINKVVDKKIRKLLEARLERFGGDPKKAFTNLDQDPIYLNEEKGIVIKRVTVTGPSEVIALHDKHDHFGNKIFDSEGAPLASDFVSTSNNHHVALFLTPEGRVEERLVSLFEATARAISEPPLPIIDRNFNKDKGWEFLMTLKRNEYVVFPGYEERTDSEGNNIVVKVFDPKSINLLDPANRHIISPYLFRIQKLSSKYYCFRHHHETTVDEVKALKNYTWKRVNAIDQMKDAVKVRVDNTGRIIAVGE